MAAGACGLGEKGKKMIRSGCSEQCVCGLQAGKREGCLQGLPEAVTWDWPI